MCPREESDLYLGLRSPLFYPLNYESPKKITPIKQNTNLKIINLKWPPSPKP